MTGVEAGGPRQSLKTSRKNLNMTTLNDSLESLQTLKQMKKVRLRMN